VYRAMERVWEPPCTSCSDGSAPASQLVLYNSLVDRKVPFVPAAGPGSKQITWYACGEWRSRECSHRFHRRASRIHNFTCQRQGL
jgi:hypothetical protein